MPHKSDKILLPRHLDRRVKLSENDIETIKALHKEGAAIRALARAFPVSRRRIQQIVNPEVGELNKLRIKANWRKYVDRKRLTLAAKNLRRYKHGLFKQKLIALPVQKIIS